MMELQLTPEQNAWIQKQVDEGKASSYSQVVAGMIDTAMNAEASLQEECQAFCSLKLGLMEDALEDAQEELSFWNGEKISYEISGKGSDEIFRNYYDALKMVSNIELEIANLKKGITS